MQRVRFVRILSLLWISLMTVSLATFLSLEAPVHAQPFSPTTPIDTQPMTNGNSTGKLTFASLRDGNWEIYVMNSDGSNQTRLTYGTYNNLYPAWSPDGSRIVFVSDRDGQYEIYIMNQDGSQLTRLTNNSWSDTFPCWSPDGRYIAYVSAPQSTPVLYRMNADGSGVRSINNIQGTQPAYSPDARDQRIAYIGADGIYILSANWTRSTKLTNYIQDGYPAWSPDGSKLVFASGRYENHYDIFTVTTDGNTELRLTNYTNGNIPSCYPSWSPDGTEIAFVRGERGNSEIYVMNSDGTSVIRRTENQFADSYMSGASWAGGSINPPGAVEVPQRWFLDSTLNGSNPVMEKTGEQGGSVNIPAGGSQIWVTDQPTRGDLIFSSGTWTLRLNTANWLNNCSAQVGEWDGANFTPFSPTPMQGRYLPLLGSVPPEGQIYFTISSGGTVSDTHYLALRISNSDGSMHTVTTAHDSWLESPDSTTRPLAADDAYSLDEDQNLVVAAPGVLINDSDADNDPLVANKASEPVHGTLTLNSNGSFTYIPQANYSGPDSFTYQASDGTANSRMATVSITVNPVNDPPTAVADNYTTDEDTALNVPAPGVLANDTDPERNPLSAVLVAGVTQGSLTLNADGSFVYTPAANYNGSDSFTYSANDGSVNSNVVTVSITVNPVNDAPVAVDDAYSTFVSTSLKVDAPGMLTNDTDSELDNLTAGSVSAPAHGTLTWNSDGSFTYNPVDNYIGNDSFTYRANDGNLESGVAIVSIIVNSQPVGPANQIRVETAATGAGMVVPSQNLATGNRLTVFSVTRDASGNFVANARPDSWLLVSKTGEIADTDLTVATDGLSATFTANKAGTFRIQVSLTGLTGVESGTITVTGSAPPPTTTPTQPPPGGGDIPVGGGDAGGGGGGGTGERQFLTPYISSAQPGLFTSEAFLKTWDGLLRLNIPKGTAAKTIENWGLSYIVLQPISQAEQKLAPPDKGNIVGLTYKLEPNGANFSPAIRLTMIYKDEQIPAGVNEKDLVIGYWDNTKNQWEGLTEGIVDIANNQITAPLSHFSTYAVLYIPPKVTPASFNLGSLSVSSATVTVGQTVTVSTLITNSGGSAGSYTVTLKINGSQVETKEVSLEPGMRQTVQFSAKRDTPGDYTIDVNGSKGTFSVTRLTTTSTQISSTTPVTGTVAAASSTSTTESTTTDTTKSKTGSPSLWVILFVVIFTMVIIGGVVMLLRRKPD